MKNKVIILVSARLESKRLKNKAIRKILGYPLILYLINNLKRKCNYKIVLCTTRKKSDDELEILAKKNSIEIFRGADKNVAKRFLDAAVYYRSDTIVRITGDNPLTNTHYLKKMINHHLKFNFDYTFCDNLPVGTTGEIIKLEALKKCYNLIQKKSSSEYLSWIINRPDIFKVGRYKSKNQKLIYPKISFTIDTLSDLRRINKIIRLTNKEYPSLWEVINVHKKKFSKIEVNYTSDIFFKHKNQNKINFNLKNDNSKKLPIIAIIQARMNSKRMPCKVLMNVGGRPMLLRVLERVSKSRLIGKIVVATSYEKQDNEIFQLCKKNKYEVYRGHPVDVLERYYLTAKKFNAKIIVRISADCPIIDWEIMDQLIKNYQKLPRSIGYGSNRLKRSFPIGTDVEIFSMENLEYTYQNCNNFAFREHVTPYMYHNLSPLYLYSMTSEKKYRNYRLTVDTKEDLKLINKIYSNMKNKNNFRLEDVINFMKNNKSLEKVNREIKQLSYHKYDADWKR